MSRSGIALRPIFGLLLLLSGVSAARAGPDIGGMASLPPYKMVRSLEFVQDSIVGGDHAAMAMQGYLLKTIDKRLRAADASDFEDSRNVDAALIYAMSGGNPATLALLASRDVEGHFDRQLTEALNAYFSGRPEAARPLLEPIQEEYRNTAIGAYVTLVTANAMTRREPKKALTLYDWVRLLAPGSILEESALRRSIELATRLKLVDQGLDYSRTYTARFLHSPYAGQFADLFVRLVVDNADAVDQTRILPILAGMDRDRQSAIYLRIARRAAVAGRITLAQTAAKRAAALSKDNDATAATLAGFYGAVAALSTPGVDEARASLAAVPDESLSTRDQALRAAALAVAREVTAPPDVDRLRQASAASTDNGGPASQTLYSPVSRSPIPSRPIQKQVAARKKAQKQFEAFVAAKRTRLKAIDALLKRDSQ